MARPTALQCIRCRARYPLSAYADDCPRCRPSGPANLTVLYDGFPSPGLRREALLDRPATLWRYSDALPVDPEAAVSLAEGMTPLVHATRLGRELGVPQLYIKDESRNPTWSLKDRLATVAVSTARQLGVRAIASSSSGNAGAAVAAYAARAGLPCIIFALAGAAGPLLTQMQAYGAMVLTVRDSSDRWTLLEAGVRRAGWFPTSPFFAPVVGSNPFGVEGYKTLAYEIAEQLAWRTPDWCVFPVCYGDALWGAWKGFGELERLGWLKRQPRMVAAEIFGSLSTALACGDDTVPEMPRTRQTIAQSIGTVRSTYQALAALRESRGTARVVGDDELLAWQRRVGAAEGLYLEVSSVAPLAAVARLRDEGLIAPDHTVVAVATAGGLKDPEKTSRAVGKAPLVPPRFDAVADVLKGTYGFDLAASRS